MNLVAVTQQLSELKVPTPQGFEDKVQEWLMPESYLVTFKVGEFGTVHLVVGQGIEDVESNPTNLSKQPFNALKYSVIRVFPLGNSWQVSIDHQDLDGEQMMHELLQIED